MDFQGWEKRFTKVRQNIPKEFKETDKITVIFQPFLVLSDLEERHLKI